MPTIDGQPAVAFDDAAILITAFTNGATLDLTTRCKSTPPAPRSPACTRRSSPRPPIGQCRARGMPASGRESTTHLSSATANSTRGTKRSSPARATTSHRLGVVHGDFWAGNLVWDRQRVAAVIDWAAARIDAPARELAWATWEFGHDHDSQTLDIDRARTFLHGYRDVTGTWQPRLEESLIPLMRVELRRNARYSLGDPGDIEYNSRLRRAIAGLRDQSALELLEDFPSPQ